MGKMRIVGLKVRTTLVIVSQIESDPSEIGAHGGGDRNQRLKIS